MLRGQGLRDIGTKIEVKLCLARRFGLKLEMHSTGRIRFLLLNCCVMHP